MRIARVASRLAAAAGVCGEGEAELAGVVRRRDEQLGVRHRATKRLYPITLSETTKLSAPSAHAVRESDAAGFRAIANAPITPIDSA